MAVKTVNSAQIITGNTDVTAHVVTIADTPGARTVKDATTFSSLGYKVNRLGIRMGSLGLSGLLYSDADANIDSVVTPAMLGTEQDWSIAVPTTGAAIAAGDWCQFGVGRLQSWSRPLQIDELGKFEAKWDTNSAFSDGRTAAPLASRTTSGLTGTAVSMTGPTATQRLYALLQVTAAAGTNLVVKIQSDDNSGFTTATDRITFTTMSAVGYQLLSVAGDLSTETYWRATATIASSTFSFAVQIGVA